MKLNLGCGPHVMDGWLNFDVVAYPGVTRMDLALGLPGTASESVDFIFSEHFIEHLDRDVAEHLFKEMYRVLKPGGVVRLSTPDLDHIIKCYKAGSISAWAPAWAPKTPAQFLNEALRLWDHRFIYDLAELRESLLMAGFSFARKATWRKSKFPELANLEIRPSLGDLIIEAIK